MSVTELAAYAAVALGGAIPWLEAIVVIPPAILFGLPAVPVTLVALLGNLSTVVLAAVAGERLRGAWQRRRARRRATTESATAELGVAATAPASAAPASAALGTAHHAATPASASADPAGTAPTADTSGQGRAQRVWRRWGLSGLAALGPVVLGTQLAALVAVTSGVPRRPAIVWITVGTTLWAIAAALATIAGVELVVA